MEDRILDAPTWSILSYPRIGIEPQPQPDGDVSWTVPPTDGNAHIRAQVLSLFDGSVSTLDDDVSFEVSYVVTLRDDGGLDIRAV